MACDCDDCTGETAKRRLRHRLAKATAEVRRLREAVIFMSGSADFGLGGKAREGFEKLVLPLLQETHRS